MSIRTVIVEENPDIRERMTRLIAESQECILTGAFSSGVEALEEIPSLNPDVAMVDVNLGDISGIEAIGSLKTVCPDTQFMVCSEQSDAASVFRALKAGASGYILKDSSDTKILDAIRDLHSGGSPLSQEIARKVVSSFHKHNAESDCLTKREAEILELLSKGYRYKEVAQHLFISLDTVRSHIRHIYEKLKVKSRTEAILKITRPV